MRNVNSESLQSLRQRPHWSFSRINSLVNFCSLAWAFKYVYRVEPLHTQVPLVFGGVYHSTLEFHMGRLAAGRDVSVEETTQLFADVLSDKARHTDPPLKLADGQTIDSLIEKGRAMVAAYIESRDPAERIVGVSVPFSVPLIDGAGQMLGKPLIGEFDLSVQRGGKYVIVDWKTAARKWPESKPRTDLQPTCYLYANYRSTGNTAAQFRFDVVTKAKEPRCHEYTTKRNAEDFARLGQLVRVLERTIAHECFYPSDSSWECKNCPYGFACQAWHRERARSFHHFELAA